MSSPNRDSSNITIILHPAHIGDNSDAESESWAQRGRYNRRRAARTNDLEANNSDSDGEPVSQQRETSTIGDLRRQINLEATQGDVSQADQDTFEEYFGDRYCRPTSPTGRGWQHTARIAAGARICNEIYGPSIDAIRDTCLEEPEFVSAGPPAGICASRRIQQRRIDAEAEMARQIQESDRAMRALNRERAHQLSLERLADACEDALREHRRSHDLAAMGTELNARAMAFKEQDPSGFEGWADHITVAHACSTSKSRQHQIIQWYTNGVPGRVLRQVRRVEMYYTTEAYLQERLLEAHVHTGARRAPDMRHHPKDDDHWAGNKNKIFFGYDPKHSTNGFSDYIPKGEGVAIIKHCAANFAARKVRLRHATAQHLPVLVEIMESFATEAMVALGWAQEESADDPALQRLFDRASDVVSEYLAHPPQYHPGRGTSSSVVGVRGEDGNDGNESDGSDIAPIRDDIESAALFAEANEARERVLERELLMDRMDGLDAAEDNDEEGAAGDVPADGSGSASMDEGSSP